ncbi:unnamed protein product [marine sediment metagenome]|uniref:Uncharacterized protein n=1 Tax=marine sediment metagenome TaxID=412755 RepID=X1VJW3_9ZZZZ
MKAKIEDAIKEARQRKPGIILSRDDIYAAIFKAGGKEVVEWVEATDILVMLSPRTRESWQTFKKERGL